MKIKRVKFHNWCQLGDREFEFTGNLIGIVGANGAGKSNLVLGVADCITGEFHKDKERCITLGQKKGSVEVELELRPDETIVISRDLHRNAASLKYSKDPSKDRSKASEVNEMVQELLGVDKTILQQIVFVRQTAISSLLFQQASQRDRLIQKFFGVEKANQLEKILSQRINGVQFKALPVPLEQRKKALDDADRTQYELAAAMDKASPQRKAWEEERLRLLTQNTDIQLFKAKSDAFVAWQNSVSALEVELQYAVEDLEAAQRDSQLVDPALASRQIERARTYVRLVNSHENLRLAERQVQGELLSLGVFPRTEQDLVLAGAELQKKRENRASMEVQLELRESAVNKLQGQARCPVCDQGISEKIIENFKWTIHQIKSALQTLTEHITQEDEKVLKDIKAFNDWNNKYQGLMGRANQISADLAKLSSEEIPQEFSGREARVVEQQIAEMEAILFRVQSARKTTPDLEADVKDKSLKLKKLKEGQPERPTPMSAEAGQVEARIQELDKQLADLAELEKRFAIANSTLHSCRHEHQMASFVSEENQALLRYRTMLETLRATFHADGAPKVLVERQLQNMLGLINLSLQSFGAPFTVRFKDGLDFECLFPDKSGPIMGDELSEGQKNVLAISFRFAACETFSSSVGLMILDEPSAPLDERFTAQFATILDNLKRIAAQRGWQFIIITHERSLRSYFDQVIEV